MNKIFDRQKGFFNKFIVKSLVCWCLMALDFKGVTVKGANGYKIRVRNPLSALPKRKNARYLPSKSELVTFKIDKNTKSRKFIYYFFLRILYVSLPCHCKSICLCVLLV